MYNCCDHCCEKNRNEPVKTRVAGLNNLVQKMHTRWRVQEESSLSLQQGWELVDMFMFPVVRSYRLGESRVGFRYPK